MVAARFRAWVREALPAALAVGTQCGFATSVGGNAISPEAQRAKLALIVRVANRVLAG